MQYVADLHLHSKYSRAVSQDMVLPTMATWGKKKGIDLLTTGDWTHPLWFREIRSQLEEANEGIYRLRHAELVSASRNKFGTSSTNEILKPFGLAQGGQVRDDTKPEPLFLLTVEVASIYGQGGKLHRIHNLIFAPNFDTAEKINKELHRRSVNLLSDGRPMMGLSSINLIELVLTIDKNALLIPCHAWTPWFSLYGSNSGFDSIEECFGDYAKYIYGVETGLSSDPQMNWRIKELDSRSILSFSDAHSPAKMGREATVFELPEISYENIRKTIVDGRSFINPQSSNFKNQSSTFNHLSSSSILYTIEFYPEEGKYHYTGHRNCKVVQTPEETKTKGSTCSVCGRKLTVGVMHRVEQLSNKEIKELSKNDEYGVKWIEDETGKRPPFVKLVPLLEIIAEALDSTTASGKVKEAYEELISNFAGEINILLKTDIAEIEKVSGPRIAQGIKKVRGGDIVIAPGFDGEYGKVKIWPAFTEASEGENVSENNSEQMGLF